MADVGSYRSRVLVYFTVGSSTDVSAYVVGESGITWTAGRPTRYDDVAAATISLDLRNSDGRFTPGNTGSPYAPNYLRGKRIEVFITSPAGTEYQIFTGSIDTVEVQLNGDPDMGVVSIKASDVLARYGRRTLDDLLVMESRSNAYAASAGSDVFRLSADLLNADSASTLTVFENRGVLKPGNSALGTLTVVPTTVPRDAGILGALDIEEADSSLRLKKFTITPVPKATSGFTGPILKYVPQGPLYGVSWYVRVPDDFVVANGSTHDRVIADFLVSGVSKMTLRLSLDNGIMRLTAVTAGTINVLIDAGDVADGAWRNLQVYRYSATQWAVEVNDSGAAYFFTGLGDFNAVNQVVFGGQFNVSDGGQSKVAPVTFAGIEGTTALGAVPMRYVTGSPPVVSGGAINLLGALISYDIDDPYGASGTVLGTTGYNVVRVDTAGRTLLEVIQEVGRSQNGYVYASATNSVTVVRANATFRTGSIGTIALEADDDATVPIVWRDAVDQNLTRVTASCPIGTATVINTSAEAAGSYNDASITTCNATIANLTTVAQAYIAGAVSLAPAQLGIDLLTAQNRTTLWSGFFNNLRPGARFTLSGIPSAIFGYSSKDLFAEGWTATFNVDQAQIVLDCSEAP